MAIEFYEKHGSGVETRNLIKGDDTTGTRQYVCIGTENTETIHNLAVANSPLVILVGGRVLNRGRISIAPTPAPSTWTVTVEYEGKKQEDDQGNFSRSFEVSQGSQHIIQSLNTVSSYKAAGVAGAIPSTQGAIGVTKDSVDGCDVPVPEAKFSETYYIPQAAFTLNYQRTVTLMCATWNDATFRGYPSGEVLFNGITASLSSEDGPWQATFTFSISPNRTGLTVGGITNITKRGWDYVWLWYADVQNGQSMRKVPYYAYVEQVLYSSDFSLLGIGT